IPVEGSDVADDELETGRVEEAAAQPEPSPAPPDRKKEDGEQNDAYGSGEAPAFRRGKGGDARRGQEAQGREGDGFARQGGGAGADRQRRVMDRAVRRDRLKESQESEGRSPGDGRGGNRPPEPLGKRHDSAYLIGRATIRS